VNLALSKPVEVSSFEPGFLPEYAVDGNLQTAWNTRKAVGKDKLPAEWIVVDLEGVASVTQVVLNWDENYPTDYTVEVSLDKSTWSTAFSTNSGSGGQEIVSIGTSTRYIRLYTTGWSSGVWRNWLAEIQVYGDGGITPPTATPLPTATPIGPTPTPTPEPTYSFHVADLNGTVVGAGKSWSATIQVQVHDWNEAALFDVQVFGYWSTDPSVLFSCTTDISGICSVVSPDFGNGTKVASFTIADLSHPAGVYAPAENHDLDGDSNGTSIEVLRPK
jgi:hypothetical protein